MTRASQVARRKAHTLYRIKYEEAWTRHRAREFDQPPVWEECMRAPRTLAGVRSMVLFQGCRPYHAPKRIVKKERTAREQQELCDKRRRYRAGVASRKRECDFYDSMVITTITDLRRQPLC